MRLETDLTAMRVRAAGLEGSLRARDREVGGVPWLSANIVPFQARAWLF